MPLVGIGTPPSRRLVCPLPPVSGGRGTLAGERGEGESQFRRDIYTVVLFIYMYFMDMSVESADTCSQ